MSRHDCAVTRRYRRNRAMICCFGLGLLATVINSLTQAQSTQRNRVATDVHLMPPIPTGMTGNETRQLSLSPESATGFDSGFHPEVQLELPLLDDNIGIPDCRKAYAPAIRHRSASGVAVIVSVAEMGESRLVLGQRRAFQHRPNRSAQKASSGSSLSTSILIVNNVAAANPFVSRLCTV